MKQYYKVWFSKGLDETAKLVVDTDLFPVGKTSITAYSRLFPYSEAGKMRVFHRSKLYPSFNAAFHADTEPGMRQTQTGKLGLWLSDLKGETRK